MNTVPMVVTILCIAVAASLPWMLKRLSHPGSLMPSVIRCLFRLARFFWALAVAVELAHHRFRQVNAELFQQTGER